MARKNSRKLSVDLHRKLSAISNCSDVSNISNRLGMEPTELRSTIHNILELDLGEAWEVESDEDESLKCYAEGGTNSTTPDDVVTVIVDKRKTSTVSETSVDSLDAAEDFQPVDVDLSFVREALKLYAKHNERVSSVPKVPEEGKADRS